MSPKNQLRRRASVMLHMVMAFVVMILLVQLWLFTVALEAVDGGRGSSSIAMTAVVSSALGCTSIWILIRLFLRAENK